MNKKSKFGHWRNIVVSNSAVSILFIPCLFPFLAFINHKIGIWILMAVTALVYSTVVHCYSGEKIWNGWAKVRWVMLCIIYYLMLTALLIPPSYFGWKSIDVDFLFIIILALGRMQEFIFNTEFFSFTLGVTIFIFVQLPSLLTYFIWLFIEKFIPKKEDEANQ